MKRISIVVILSIFHVVHLNSVISPSLIQHKDGRFFAVNANLSPGQLFATADGRIFTLAQKSATTLSSPPKVVKTQPQTAAPVRQIVTGVTQAQQEAVGVQAPQPTIVRVVAPQGLNSIIAPAQQDVVRVASTQQPTVSNQQRLVRVSPLQQAVADPGALQAVQSRVVQAQKTRAQTSEEALTGYYTNVGAGFGYNFL